MKSYETFPRNVEVTVIYSSVLPEEIGLTSCPVTFYWLKVCTHGVKISSTISGNHGNVKLNI